MSDNWIDIVMAEDEQAHAEAIQRSFRTVNPRARFRVAASLREYGSLVREKAPDIALVDFNLPDGRAVDVLTSPADAGPFPVLVMTSFGNEQVAVEAMRAGAIDYVVKSPESFKTMPRTVEQALREWALLRARRQDEARIKHLNAVLRGIRNVNQLITREKDPGTLVRKACEMLVESRGFLTSTIVQIDNGRVSDVADAGRELDLERFRRLLGANVLPACLALAQETGLFVRGSEQSACRDCGIRPADWQEHDVLAVRLQSEGRTFGVLVVTLPVGTADDPEEQELLREVAGDVAYALRNLEIERHFERTSVDLQDTRDTLAAIVAASPAAIVSITPDGKVRTWNRAAEAMFGWTAEEVVGAMLPIVPAEAAGEYRALRSRVLAGDAFSNLELDRVRRDGTTISVSLSTSPLRDEKGNVVGIIAVFVDITVRKVMERQLRESESRFRAAFDQASVARSLTEPDGRLARVNRRMCELLGYSNEELAEMTFHRITHPDDLQETTDNVKALLEGTRQSFHVEKRYLHRDGHVVWAEASSTLVRDDLGRPVNFVTDIVDISQRKAAEESQQRFNAQLEQLAGVVQQLSEARSMEAITDIVRTAARSLTRSDGATFVLREGDMCRYVEEDAIAPLWRGRFFPLSACVSGWVMGHGEEAIIEDVYQDERVPLDAYRATFIQGLAMVPIGRQAPVGAIGTYWAHRYRATPEELRILRALADSTWIAMENVRHLQELQTSEARTRAIYEHIPNPTLVWRRSNGGFELVDFNEAAVSVTGGAVQALVGRPPSELEGAWLHLEEDLETCWAGRTTVRREEECSLSNTQGRQVMVLTYSFVPTDLVLLHAQDVTGQRQTEEQLRVSQRLEAVGRLAGGVAHDFNNLLSVIINYASFGLTDVGKETAIGGYFEEIQTAGERAAALTHQLLAFSRKQLLQPEVLNLNEVISNMERMLRRLLGEDIRICLHLAPDVGNVMADPGQIEQVLLNLAVNARDAMLQGGTLTIESCNMDLDDSYAEEHVGVSPGRHVMFSVSDTGTGMEEEVKEHIFEPFFTTKEKGRGTGLGLSTVYGIVKQSGGSIWVYSEPGQGSTFKVYLPRVSDVRLETERPRASAAPRGIETVLVVEDEDGVRRMAERILRSAGYHVLSAASGAEALKLCERPGEEIALLLTDVVMPQMSGRKLAERMAEGLPRMKVLYMSGYTDNAIVHHGVLDPGMKLISKPFSADSLTRKVREVLDE